MSKTLLTPLCNTFWCITTTRHYARKVRVIPSPIKVDAEVHVSRRENPFKTKPEHLFLQEIEGEFEHSLTVEQMHFLAEDRKEEMKKLDKKMYFKTIEKKYFKELKQSEPNLLTWAMKEHLYTLHQSDPELWDIQSLSYAFPKSPAAIKKFLAVPRKSYTPEQIKEHDMKVIENWKTLTKDKLGNYAILKKMVNKRLSSINKETSLSLPADETFPNVIFTPTDDPTVDEIRSAKQISHSSIRWRRENPTFKDIITQFEDLKRQNDPSSARPPPSHDISTEKPLTQVSLDHHPRDVEIRSPFAQRKPSSMDRFRKNVTLEEYKYLKKLK